MTGIDDNGQMRQFMEHRHGREIEGIARIIREGTDAAFAEDDALVAAGHDVFGGHEEFLQRVGEAALEEDGLVRPAELSQQIEVLHIARTDLDDVHIGKELQIAHVHELRHDGQAGLLPRDTQQLQSGCLEAGEIIGRGARLKGASPQDLCAGRLDRGSDRHDLFLALHRAGARDQDEMSAADLHVPDLDDHVLQIFLSDDKRHRGICN